MEIIEHDYQPGRPWSICDRCGQRRRLDCLRKEWSSLMVCDDCYDPRPDTMLPPRVGPEGLPYPDARPDQPASFVNVVTPDDL